MLGRYFVIPPLVNTLTIGLWCPHPEPKEATKCVGQEWRGLLGKSTEGKRPLERKPDLPFCICSP
jgi:hypothetical protein